MIFNNGERSEKYRVQAAGRSFQRCAAVMDMAQLENLRCVLCNGRVKKGLGRRMIG